MKQRQVEVEDAQLNLSYATVITAAEDGKMYLKVNVQQGQFLQAGQPVYSVSFYNSSIWVVANFKETQYKNMKVGQECNYTCRCISKA